MKLKVFFGKYMFNTEPLQKDHMQSKNLQT